MKILAIRGENLASLGGAFAVELGEDPLASAGLFAITGPTGAGKSTLLDALCLALFDQTPRLTGKSTVGVGRAHEEEKERLGINDPRSVLRKGCGEGHAQVDFLGSDGRRYQATWRVWRARRRPTGQLQPTQVDLRDLEADQPIGGAKKETLAAIEERLGLSFDQFRRSVLLAQGDFAAFLKATGTERSALLERMTGTALYSELSKAAHERARDERQKLKDLEGRADALAFLSDEDRAALEDERAACDQARARAGEERDRLKTAQRWEEERRRLEEERVQAQANEAAQVAVWEEAAPRRDRLQKIEAAEPLRGALTEADRAAREAEQAAAAVGPRVQQAQGAEERARRAAGAVAQAQSQLQAARDAQKERAPEIERAAQLDTEVAAAAARLREAETAEAARRQEARDATQAAADLSAKIQAAEARLRDIKAQLAELAGDAALAREWPRWEAELGRCAQAAQEAAHAQAAIDALDADKDARQAAVTSSLKALEVARQARQQAAASLEAAQGSLAQIDRPGLRAQRDALEEGLLRLGRLETLAAGAAREQAAAAERRAALEVARAAHSRHQQEEGRAREQEAAVSLQRAEAAAALERLQTALSLSDHRAALKEGEPCPLCGALDHPWATGAPPAAVNAQRARVEELAASLKTLTALISREGALAAKEAQAADAAAKDLEAAQVRIAEAVDQWRRTAGSEPPAGLPAELDPARVEEVRAGIEAGQAALKAERQALSERETNAAARAQAVDAARSAHDAAREAVSAREQEAREAASRSEQAEKDRAHLDERRQRSQAVAEAAAAALEPALGPPPSWRQRLEVDGAAFIDAARHRATGYLKIKEEGDALDRQLDALHPQGDQAARASLASVKQAEAARAEADQARAAHGALQAQRRALLEGRPVAEVRDALEAAINGALERREAHQAALSDAQGALAAAIEARETAQRVRDKAAQDQQAASLVLQEALTAAGMDLPTLRERLTWDPPRVSAERQALQGIDQALSDARILHGERQRRLVAHLAAEHPAYDAATHDAALAAADAAWAAADEARARADARLRQDEGARSAAAGLIPVIEAQAKVSRLWGDLSELIGSHDGKKLRGFAQSLTLDALLMEANHQLQDLARRFSIERIPGTEMELQVIDGDMGDEVRTVNSLSGGEGFLVSLALALGLASLSSHQTRIDSLFIDEGFGSLDPATLEIALAALDALQATGRQVGLISHVSGMAERIGVQVRVKPVGGGRSQLRTLSAASGA